MGPRTTTYASVALWFMRSWIRWEYSWETLKRLTGDELVVVAFGASKGVRTLFGRTAYDVRAAHRSGVEYEWVLIGPPSLTQLRGWG